MSVTSPYSQLAAIYDNLFFALGKDYSVEAQRVSEFIKQYKRSSGNCLMDLGCGTGEHIKYLRQSYDIVGIDVSEEMLELAKQKNPDVIFHKMNMLDFKLSQKFDAIICLFRHIK